MTDILDRLIEYSVHVFEVSDSLVADGEKGLIAKQDVPVGTLIPYFAVVIDAEDDGDSTYKMAAYTMDDDGELNVQAQYAFDGAPDLFEDEQLTYGSRVNETLPDIAPNTMLMPNPLLQTFKKDDVVLAALMVTVEPIEAGKEVLTYYGSHYGQQQYQRFAWTGCKDAEKTYLDLVDAAYDYLDAWLEELERSM